MPCKSSFNLLLALGVWTGLAPGCQHGHDSVARAVKHDAGSHGDGDTSMNHDPSSTPDGGDGDQQTTGDGDTTPQSDSGTPARPETTAPPPGGAFVHLFEWKWTDIAEECERYLGPNGFSALQVSPPSEHAVLSGAHYPWWQRYQTVSYSLERSRSGTLAEFKDMVTRCARVGVGIYVDAVLNHMTAQGSGTGSNGSQFTKYSYPPLYDESDFHTPHCAIQDADWTASAEHVQRCELLGLADLDTGSAGVRDKIAGYLSGLVELGVRGFRIDAAKHISVEDLSAVVSQVQKNVGDERAPYYYFEIFNYGGEAVNPEDYLPLSDVIGKDHASVIEFRYALLGNYFLNRNGALLAQLETYGDSDSGFVPADRAVVFVDNHDTQRNDALFYQDGARYDLATVFLLAWPYGYPSLMSSFSFARPAGKDVGPPSDAEGHTNAIYHDGEPDCASEAVPLPGKWVCEHRRVYVPGMLALRKKSAGSEVSNWWDNGNNQIAFARTGKSFVAINGEDGELTRSFDTGLPSGDYCDVVQGNVQPGSCPGRVIHVGDDGKASLTLAPLSAAAIYVGATQ